MGEDPKASSSISEYSDGLKGEDTALSFTIKEHPFCWLITHKATRIHLYTIDPFSSLTNDNTNLLDGLIASV